MRPPPSYTSSDTNKDSCLKMKTPCMMAAFLSRAHFLLESVHDLKARLRSILGSDLLVLVGKPEDLLPGMLHDVHLDCCMDGIKQL